ncbi:predicted membrane-associated Zn-dependent protease 1 [Pelotomaculum thermopropionicum SI]|uniref:Predicted membrane-associated Zn-dependent protease 1 n=1 Tax=Pelotomaculum thermopropionicum (strain DSM 13744 / JCM 10971 / SI) TaxID=370438 RepID=A5D302_PELTS|nr:predicted membrane-associated Zn-dependent protease 1 [Pelotomaculum thermopropionicum SI]
MRGRVRRLFCGFMVFLSCVMTWQAKEISLLPDRQYVFAGEPLKINFPALVERSLRIQVCNEEPAQGLKPEMFLPAGGAGPVKVRLSLLGVIPVKDITVSVLPQVKVIPGGQSIGVLLHSQGVIVMGRSDILNQTGRFVNPAADAGIKEGDIILKINGEAVRAEDQVRELVAQAGAEGRELALEVKRGEKTFQVRVKPVFCKETLRYRMGLLIRDSTAGIGTLTFYDPEKMIYGALGHVITDLKTNQPVDLSGGKVTGASVQSIHRGKRGQPGEKIGMFTGDTDISGTIAKNTKMGIFGRLQKPLENQIFQEPIPVAPAVQVREGEAEILTVLNGEKVERFTIEIVKVNLQARQNGKGLVIKITDPRLLEQTGGIIQGMSGSPIIQDNRLVGAVTHVFVNDPTRGYGVPAEWMLQEADMLPEASEGQRLAS